MGTWSVFPDVVRSETTGQTGLGKHASDRHCRLGRGLALIVLVKHLQKYSTADGMVGMHWAIW